MMGYEPPRSLDDVRVHGLVLAAGAARRMGSRKQLLDWHGSPMLRHTTATLSASRVASVTVVVPPAADEVEAALAGLGVIIAVNEAPELGLLRSLKVGLISCLPRLGPNDGVMVALADQPLVTTADQNLLVAAFREQRGEFLVCPSFAGQRGNPVVIPASLIPEILARPDADRGAAFLFAAYPEIVREVPMATDAVHRDCDTPDDYARMRGL